MRAKDGGDLSGRTRNVHDGGGLTSPRGAGRGEVDRLPPLGATGSNRSSDGTGRKGRSGVWGGEWIS